MPLLNCFSIPRVCKIGSSVGSVVYSKKYLSIISLLIMSYLLHIYKVFHFKKIAIL